MFMDLKFNEQLREMEGRKSLAKFAKKLLSMISQKIVPEHLIFKEWSQFYRDFCYADKTIPFSVKVLEKVLHHYGMKQSLFKDKKGKRTGGYKLNPVGLEKMANEFGASTITNGFSIIRIGGVDYYMQIIMRPMKDDVDAIFKVDENVS